MKTVNIYEAKTQLSKLLLEVEAGEEIIIGRYGRPVAKLVPYADDKPKYRLGVLRGKIRVAKDFDGGLK